MGFAYPIAGSYVDELAGLSRAAYESTEKAKTSVELEKWGVALEESSDAVKNLMVLRHMIQQMLLKALGLRAEAYLGQKKYPCTFHNILFCCIVLKISDFSRFFRAKQDCELMLDLKSVCPSIQKSIDNSIQESEWHTLIGQAYAGMFQVEASKLAYQKAILSNPNNAVAKLKLSNIFAAENALLNLPISWKLPDELWVRIFSYLDIKSKIQVELVCKNWKKMAPLSWKVLRGIPGDWWPSNASKANSRQNFLLKPEFFCGLIEKCGQWCTAIDIGCVDVSRVRLTGLGRFRLRNKLKQLLSTVCQNCPNLSTLNVPSAALLDEDLQEIFQHLPRLESLSLEKVCRTPEGRFDGEVFDQAPTTLRDVRLHFAPSSPCLSDTALHRLADRLGPNLDHFKFCSDWDNFCGEAALSHLLDSCQYLTTVKLGCLGREGGEHLTDSCLVKLGHLRNLTTLYLWVIRISNFVVDSLVQGCKKLVSLELHAEIMDLEALTEISKFHGLNDLRLDVISGLPWASLLPQFASNNGKTLKILALSGLNGSELSIALDVFPAMEQLCMWNSVNIDSAALVAIISRYKTVRTNALKLIASCYHVQIDQPLKDSIKESTQFSLGCYYDHQPCDLTFNRF